MRRDLGFGTTTTAADNPELPGTPLTIRRRQSSPFRWPQRPLRRPARGPVPLLDPPLEVASPPTCLVPSTAAGFGKSSRADSSQAPDARRRPDGGDRAALATHPLV